MKNPTFAKLCEKALGEIAKYLPSEVVICGTMSTLTLYPDLLVEVDAESFPRMCADETLERALRDALKVKVPDICTLRFSQGKHQRYTKAQQEAMIEGANNGLRNQYRADLTKIFARTGMEGDTAYMFACHIHNEPDKVRDFLRTMGTGVPG